MKKEAGHKQLQFKAEALRCFMMRAFITLTITLAVLFLLNGCQAMTGETMDQNIDDGTLTSYVKTKLATDKLVTLSRVGVETNKDLYAY